MAVWEHLRVDKAHIAYAVVGVFSAVFSLISLFVKEKLYIGEATVAAITGLIVGPHCLNWFAPTTWGNTDYITLELSRIVLCLQIFAVAVELPKKYMLKHWLSVTMLLVPVMTAGWLIVGLFVWIVIPGLNFAESLVVSACVTATDPVLAAAVVGKGKFARRVPGHLRNLLTAESGCNDGMAFPFIYLGINLVIHAGNGREIVKDWICVTILYECIFGCILGAFIGWVGRRSIKFAHNAGLIDRESFLAFYVVLAFACAGFGSMLGTDDLLVSFAAGTAFSWDGWFAKRTEESHVSTVIDLLLNLAYFVYFGAIIPWPQFNNAELGLDAWRLVIIAIVIIFLRRLPAVLALKPFIPDVKTWREAFFVGHFGPIGVGAVFAAILARGDLEGAHTTEATPLAHLPSEESDNYQLIAVIWPIVTFVIITSIIVHGSSVAVITLGKHLNTMAISMSFTTTQGNQNSSSWMSRLPELKTNGRSFSLHRIDTMAPTSHSASTSGADNGQLSQAPTVETSGIPARPAGGMDRRKKKSKKSKKHRRRLHKIHSHHGENEIDTSAADTEKLQREREAKAAAFALGGPRKDQQEDTSSSPDNSFVQQGITPATTFNEKVPWPTAGDDEEAQLGASDRYNETTESDEKQHSSETSENNLGAGEDYERNRRPSAAYTEGNKLIIEDQHGEILDQASMDVPDRLKKKDSERSRKSSSKRSKSPASSLTPLTKRSSSVLERVSSGNRDRPKYTAYKLDDQLVIENEDGEILRRYKINHHKTVQQKTRSASLAGGFGKALSAVGIKSNMGANKDQAPLDNPDLEIQDHLQLEPLEQPEPVRANDDDIHEEVDSELEEVTSDEEESGSEDEESEEDSDDEESDDDEAVAAGVVSADQEETTAERNRRLAAIGQVDAPRDESDEEEFLPTQPVQNAPQAQQAVRSSADQGQQGSKSVLKELGRGLKRHTNSSAAQHPVEQSGETRSDMRQTSSIKFQEPSRQ